jgi:hypothetical protein
MDYTPRQLDAFLIIAEHRRCQDLSQQLVLGTLVSRGDEKAIRAKLKEWDVR